MLVHEETGIKQSFKITLTLEGVIIETHGPFSEIYKEVYSNYYSNVRSVRLNNKFLFTEFFIDDRNDLVLNFDLESIANTFKMLIEIGKRNPNALYELIGANNQVLDFDDTDFDEDRLSELSKRQHFFAPQHFIQQQQPAPQQAMAVPPLPSQPTPTTGFGAPPPPPVFAFYAMIDNVQRGPYNEIQFKRLVDNELASGDTLVWTEGMLDWKPAREVKMMSRIFPKQKNIATNPTPAMPQMPQVLEQSIYYVNINNQQAGPFTMQQLKQFAQTGEFTQQMYVWKEGMPQWLIAGQVQELASLFTPQMPPMPKI